MFIKKWRKIIHTNSEGKADIYWLYGTKREARKFAKEMRKRNFWQEVYHIISTKERTA